jgi:ComB9 competence protein
VSRMRTKFLFALMLASAAPSVLLAQVPSSSPTRPGLNLPAQAPYAPPPTTDFVQRNYDPSQAGQPFYPQQSNDEFFYTDENSTGPDDLADGLSDYNGNRMSQTGQQLRGNYGGLAQSGMPAGMTQEAWNRPFDNMSDGQSAPGTIRYQWSADLIMPVRLRAGMVSSIVLPEWETAQDVVIGDPGTIEASILRPNQVAVKSVQTGLDTSMSITGGSGNIYTFYLRTEGRNTDLVTDLQVFVQAAPSKGSGAWFNKEMRNVGAPSAKPASASSAAAGQDEDIMVPGAASQGDEPVPSDRRIFNMKMFEVNEGDRVIAPEYVYTDGRFTYLHFAAGVTDRPAVFRIVDGVEGRVNTRVTGRHSEVIIIEALGDFVLRSGTRAVCIKAVDGDDQVAIRS